MTSCPSKMMTCVAGPAPAMGAAFLARLKAQKGQETSYAGSERGLLQPAPDGCGPGKKHLDLPGTPLFPPTVRPARHWRRPPARRTGSARRKPFMPIGYTATACRRSRNHHRHVRGAGIAVVHEAGQSAIDRPRQRQRVPSAPVQACADAAIAPDLRTNYGLIKIAKSSNNGV